MGFPLTLGYSPKGFAQYLHLSLHRKWTFSPLSVNDVRFTNEPERRLFLLLLLLHLVLPFISISSFSHNGSPHLAHLSDTFKKHSSCTFLPSITLLPIKFLLHTSHFLAILF